MRQMKQVFGSPRLRVAAQWPDEAYFKQAIDFEPILSAWRLIGFSVKNQAVLQIFKYLQAEIMAKAYSQGVRNNIPRVWLELLNSYDESDLVAAVTGNQMYSTGRFGWPFPIKIFMVNIAHYLKKPLIIMPQSIGPLRWNWEKSLLRRAYGRAQLIMLRDQISLQLAKEIDLPQDKVHYFPDPAFDYPPADPEVASTLLKRYNFDSNAPAMGMTVIPRYGRSVSLQTMNQYYRGLSRFLETFHNETGINVYLFNQVSGPTIFDDDNVGAQKLLEYLKGRPWLTYVNEALSPGTLKACYGFMDLFLATRMHSGIFSLGMGVPVLFIGYHTKARGMMQSLGLEEWVVDLENVSYELLLEKALRAWKQRQEYRQILSQKIPEVKKQVNEIPGMIRGTFAQFTSKA